MFAISSSHIKTIHPCNQMEHIILDRMEKNVCFFFQFFRSYHCILSVDLRSQLRAGSSRYQLEFPCFPQSSKLDGSDGKHEKRL